MGVILALLCTCFRLSASTPGQAVEWGVYYNNRSTALAVLTNVVEISANSYWSVALRADGSLYAWGNDSYGQVSQCPTGHQWAYVAAGWTHGIACDTSGKVTEWGEPYANTTSLSQWVALRPPDLSTDFIVKVAAGDNHSAALGRSGKIYLWGGRKAVTNYNETITNAADLASGWYYIIAALKDGTVVARGETAQPGYYYTPPTGLTNIAKVAASLFLGYAIESNGVLHCWGTSNNTYGEITVPPYVTNVVSVGGGQYFTIAARADGKVFAWGDNSYGQLNIPVIVTNCTFVTGGPYSADAIQVGSIDPSSGPPGSTDPPTNNYYVSPGGFDTDPGTALLPWRTIGHALSAMPSGGTLWLNNGTYYERNTIRTSLNGTPGNPTVIRAINPLMVTNIGGFNISQGGAGYITWDGIVFEDGTNTPDWAGLLNFWHSSSGAGLGAGYTITNCWFVGVQDPTKHNIVGVNMETATNAATCAADFKLLNCVFTNLSQYEISIMVTNGLVANNRFDFANTHDAIHCWGQDIWISNNVFTNISANPLVSDHTDILQYWGQNSAPLECSNVYFCYNRVVNCDAQMFEIQPNIDMNGPPTSAIGGLYVFNNLYEHDVRPGFVDCPESHFWNNTWYQCRLRTVPDDAGSTILVFGGTSNPFGTAANSSVFNCAFIDCGNSNYLGEATAGFFNSGNTGTLPNFTADYNFVCGAASDNYPAKNAGAWTFTNTINLHSINGGNPYLADAAHGDYHLTANSPLVDAGTSSSLFSDDLDHLGRPQGLAWDIGAYEFDPTLKLHFDFASDFSSGVITDITGYGHNGIRFSSTNWPYATNVDGRAAARFTVVPGNLIEPPTDSGWGDYIAVTNLLGISTLTNGTVSIWARYYQTTVDGTNWNEATSQRLFDGGYQGMPWSSGTFFIGRGYDPVSGDVYHTVLRRYDTNALANPTTLFAFPDGSMSTGGDTGGWHQYVITWDGTNVYGYFDGTNFAVASMGVPYFSITNDYHWFSLGCWSHDGTPQWDGDGYPNNGWFNGVLGDVRIYNRALPASGVENLFHNSGDGGAGNGGSGGGGGGGPQGSPPSPPFGLHVVQ